MTLEYEMRMRIQVEQHPGARPTVVETSLHPLDATEDAATAPNHSVADAWQELIEDYEEEQQRLENQVEELTRELAQLRAVLHELQCEEQPEVSPQRDAGASDPPHLMVIETRSSSGMMDAQDTDPMLQCACAPLQIGNVTEAVLQSCDPDQDLGEALEQALAAPPAPTPITAAPRPVSMQRRAMGTAVNDNHADDLDDLGPIDQLLPEPWYKRTLRFALGGTAL